MSTKKTKQTLKERYSSPSVVANSKNIMSKKHKFPGKILIFFAGTLVVAGIIAAMTVLNKDGSDDVSSFNVVVTPENISELLAENTSKTPAGSYDVSMNSTWRFDNSRSASENAYVENIISNTNTVHFTLTRNDTNSVIYESPYIPVGSSLRNIKLDDESLGRGTYPCTVTYRLVDDNRKEISTVKISVTIEIKNN